MVDIEKWRELAASAMDGFRLAAFRARFDPKTVTALLDEVERLSAPKPGECMGCAKSGDDMVYALQQRDYWREKTAILRAAADEMHVELTRMHGRLCAEKSHAARLERERDEAIAERDKARGRADYLQASLDAERLMR